MKLAILLLTHGAGNAGARASLSAFEILCRERFPGVPVRWAYASDTLRERLARQKQKRDSLEKALNRLAYEKFDAAAIQPLRAIRGGEYEETEKTARRILSSGSMRHAIGAPLLSRPEDAPPLAGAVLASLPKARLRDEDVVLMGHGTRHSAFFLYDALGVALAKMDPRVYFGVQNDAKSLDAILPRLASRKVWLLPLLSLVGSHAIGDMAGSQPESWRSRIEKGGHQCDVVLRGLSENPRVCDIWLNNLNNAVNELINPS